ncbi:DUF417 family protein [Streptomyces sp. PTY087I2]|uniref:DUF417 family protein n=1 Tax=Streptomyces sp. PTY087I2 TaxID=1819298 RepID=UPI0008280BC2|nr:DUF417 family protein [Streptomyces sp. PTY087I2]OCC09030.1 hypothetical protein A3Q37_05051 [Streptomyces sp. PTY087I2]
MSSHTVEPSLPPTSKNLGSPLRDGELERTPHAPGPQLPLPRRLAELVDEHALTLLRATVGIVFVGFGVLKLFPSASPAEQLAVDAATKMTLGLVPETVLLLSLAALETAIGIGLIVGRSLLRPALVAFFLHMGGVFSTLFLLPDAMWQPHSPAPTMEGQYVVKNVVLVAVCMVVAANEWSRGYRSGRPDGAG